MVCAGIIVSRTKTGMVSVTIIVMRMRTATASAIISRMITVTVFVIIAITMDGLQLLLHRAADGEDAVGAAAAGIAEAAGKEK